jgi:hypothetical protein
MSQPPVDPAGLASSTDASPTEPLPAFEPAPAPQGAASSPPPAGPPTGPAAADLAFTPVEPEPGPGQASAVLPAPALSGGRSGSVSSRPLLVAIAAVVLVAVAAVAFAAGRTIVPASDTTGGVSNRQEQQGGGAQGGRPGQDNNGQGQGRGNDGQGNTGKGDPGQGTGNGGQGNRGQGHDQFPGGGWMDQNGQGQKGGGTLPGASFDPNGNSLMPGRSDGGGDGSMPGTGLGRAGMRGLDLAGTVTAVTPDSVTIKTEAGMTVTVGLDSGTTYHQQAPAASSDVTTGTKIQVQLDGGVRPSRDANGNINLGTAGDITVVP